MLEEFPIFTGLSKADIDKVEKIARQVSLKKGAVLFRPGDSSQGFYAVISGAIRVYRISSRGKEITLEIIGPKGTLAEASLFSDIYHCHAEALKDSTLYQIGRTEFLKLIREDSHFALEWIRLMSRKVIQLNQRIEELLLKSPRAKIASYISFLAEIHNSSSITLPAYQKAIATLLGMTQETFYRTARELEEEGIVCFNGQQIEIINHSRLKDLIE